MKEVVLTKEQAQVLLMLAGQEQQIIKQAEQIRAAQKAQTELLKAYYKIEGEVQLAAEGDNLVMRVLPKPEPVQEASDQEIMPCPKPVTGGTMEF